MRFRTVAIPPLRRRRDKSPRATHGKTTFADSKPCLRMSVTKSASARCEFVFQRRESVDLWIDPALAASAAAVIADPDALLARPDCRIIKDQKKIKVGRLTLSLDGRPRPVYVKRYNAFSPRIRIVSLFTKSGARRALEGAAILRQARIETAQPIAAVELRRHGMLAASFFVSDEITGGKTADQYWQQDLAHLSGRERFRRRRRFLRGLARVFSSLHAARIYHNDLKDANILVTPTD